MSYSTPPAGINEGPNVSPGSATSAFPAGFFPQAWEKAAVLAQKDYDFFKQFEGGNRSPIWTKKTTRGKGATVNFQEIGELRSDGVVGDVPIIPEAWIESVYPVVVDQISHGTEYTRRTEYLTGLEDEIRRSVPNMLGNWMGQKKTTQMLMQLRYMGTSGSNTIVYMNAKANRDALRGSDTLTMDNIITFSQTMKTAGAMPSVVKGDRKGMVLVALGESLRPLKASDAYRKSLQEGDLRGSDNKIFAGGYPLVDGNVICDWDPIDGPWCGPIGSSLNPKAKLGQAIVAANGASTSLTIYGGGTAAFAAVTTAMFFENFSNYAYTFNPSLILSQPISVVAISGGTQALDTTVRYIVIYNIVASTLGTDAGKWGFYSYVVNGGNTLTTRAIANSITNGLGVGSRLAASASGYDNTTLGYVVWNSAVNTDTHPLGSLIVEANAYGQPFARSIIMAAGASMRAYGMVDNHRSEWALQGGRYLQVYIDSFFGQSPRQRADGLTVGYKVIEHAISYAGFNLPSITVP